MTQEKFEQPSAMSLARAASRRLSENKNSIKSDWERRVRETVPAAEGKDTFAMLNSLENFLDELIKLLDTESFAPELISETAMSVIHGGQRAVFPGYYLPQLLKEFSLLREILIEDFYQNQLLSYSVLKIVNSSIDFVISKAATEFAKVQNENLTEALRNAELSNESLEHFAAAAAHDLKSPLATIYGYLEVLGDDLQESLNAENASFIDRMKDISLRMLGLIDRILEYAKLSTAKTAFRVFPLTEAVRAATQNLDNTIGKAGAVISVQKLPNIRGDKDLLVQLFQNLFANSLKFRGVEAPRIAVGVKDAGEWWTFSVKDNGIGFDAVQKDDIFTLYKKLHDGSQYQGAGIGLATCKKVVELHGGQIWADSHPGQGTTIFFSLPKA